MNMKSAVQCHLLSFDLHLVTRWSSKNQTTTLVLHEICVGIYVEMGACQCLTLANSITKLITISTAHIYVISMVRFSQTIVYTIICHVTACIFCSECLSADITYANILFIYLGIWKINLCVLLQIATQNQCLQSDGVKTKNVIRDGSFENEFTSLSTRR